MSALTPKQEGFCRTYIETGNASEAYRQNYNISRMKPESVGRRAKEVMDNRKITARIQALQKIHQKRHEVTVDSLTRELEEDRQLARELGQPAAAVSALNVKARIHGLDKQVLSNDPDNPMPAAIHIEIVHR